MQDDSIKLCEWCGTPLVGKQARSGRFCNRRCASDSAVKQVIVNCATCETAFSVKRSELSRPGRRAGRFCSRACRSVGMRREHASLEDRFWAKINKNGPIPEHRPELGNCWVWAGRPNPGGRPRIYVSREVTHAQASRVAWELTNGPIPDGLEACHHCDGGDIGCVRSDHLFLGTHAENMADMAAKGRGTPGEKSPNAKLTDEWVREIRRLFDRGVTVAELAKLYPVSEAALAHAIARVTWKHVV